MSTDLDLFYEEYMQELIISAESEGNFNEPNFTEKMCDFLVEEGAFPDYYLVSYKKKDKGLKVDAWSYDPIVGVLNLVVSVFNETDDVEVLTNTEIEKTFNRVGKFFKESLDINFYQSLDESDPAYSLAELISDFSDNIKKIKFTIISNHKLSSRIKKIDKQEYLGYSSQRDIWDIERIFRAQDSFDGKEPITINFHDSPLPVLPAYTGDESFQSYLLALPGSLLASLYEDYGDRLLEQNVRTFLQFRGKVNKGLKNTILNHPEMFFAYNNGVTATAEEVEIENNNGSFELKSVKNLQIVNGGQTTASLFTTSLQNRKEVDLSKVFVQMKLTIIKSEFEEEDDEEIQLQRAKSSAVISNISEFSNTQNKVNAADLSSNHEFHVRMEGISRRLWAPAKQSSTHQTKWFYERLRGQFNNRQSNLSPSKKKEFLKENPRAQLIVKTDLAKFTHSWDKLPHVVSTGAQKNFIRFIEGYKKEKIDGLEKNWVNDEASFNDDYFKDLVVKAILFRELDKLIMKQPWYDGYKANIVTYSIAKLRDLIDSTGKSLDLGAIYKKQETPAEITNLLLLIAEEVDGSLKDTPFGISNISEYAKKVEAWEAVKQLEIDFDLTRIDRLLISKDKQEELKKDGAKKQVLTKALEIEMYVVNKGPTYWKKVLTWGNEQKLLTEKEIGVLETASQMPRRMPSSLQSKIIYAVEDKMVSEGFPSDAI